MLLALWRPIFKSIVGVSFGDNQLLLPFSYENLPQYVDILKNLKWLDFSNAPCDYSKIRQNVGGFFYMFILAFVGICLWRCYWNPDAHLCGVYTYLLAFNFSTLLFYEIFEKNPQLLKNVRVVFLHIYIRFCRL